MRERNFTPSGADELISEWKRTMSFAGLAEPGATVSPDVGEGGDQNGQLGEEEIMTPPDTIQQERQDTPPNPPPSGDKPKAEKRRERTVQVPYSPTSWALVQASFPMTEREWDQMLAVLAAMKTGLVSEPDEQSG